MEADYKVASFSRILRFVVLLAWLLALWALVQWVWGPPLLRKFMSPNVAWIIGVGIVILALFLIFLVYCDPFRHGKRGAAMAMEIGFLVLPLIYLPVASFSEFSPQAFKNRFLFSEAEGIPRGMQVGVGYAIPPENPSLIHIVFYPDFYERKEVAVEGKVYRDAGMPGQEFYCYRFLMRCCSADARPIALRVRDESGTVPANGSWVRIKGIVTVQESGGKRTVQITAGQVEPTMAPRDEYLEP